VALQEFDEMLAHHSGGAQDAYFDARLHNSFTMRLDFDGLAELRLRQRSSFVCAE